MTRTEQIVEIKRTTLHMNEKFRLSELVEVLATKGIVDMDLILEGLNQLYESGVVDSLSGEEEDLYKNNFAD